MAIKITSNKIFDIKNEIIRDNQIGKIEAKMQNVFFEEKLQECAYQIKYDTEQLNYYLTKETLKTEFKNGSKTGVSLVHGYYGEAINLLKFGFKRKMFNIEISKAQYDKYLSKLYNGIVAGEKKTGLDINFTYTKEVYPIQKSVNLEIKQDMSFYPNTVFRPYPEDLGEEVFNNITIKEVQSVTEGSGSIITEEEQIAGYAVEENPKTFIFGVTANTSVIETNPRIETRSPINVFNVSLNDNGDSYMLGIVITIYREKSVLYKETLVTNIDAEDFEASNFFNPSRTLEGTIEKITPETLEFSIFGDYIQINLDEETFTLSSNSGNSFKISGNELLQKTNTYEGNSAIKTFAKKLIENYKNGKETATLKCSITNYFDENNQIVIDVDNNEKMCFNIGDKVIPYIYTSTGEEKPMSLKEDGTPKVFQVVQRKINLSGAFFQEITIQEINE